MAIDHTNYWKKFICFFMLKMSGLFVGGQTIRSKEMKLDYDLIEDAFDDTTNIRTMTEQARVSGGGWMVRSTIYTPHHLSVAVTFVPVKGKKKKLFDPIA